MVDEDIKEYSVGGLEVADGVACKGGMLGGDEVLWGL